jgi:hypothetical protein
MLKIAFKEWASVCRALALGQQTVILRKGGIAEVGGAFQPDYDRFWLYPTYFHEQQQAGVKPAFLPLLQEAEQSKPASGTLILSHWAEVEKVEYLTDLDEVLKRNGEHILNEATVTQRFHYRRAGSIF